MIEPYYEDSGLRLYHGKCEVLLKEFPDAHFDSVVCDPPYELGFMGKGWDSSGIAFDVEMWAEVMRVLKPGGYILAFGGTRTYHRMAVAIEDAGFEIRDSIAWLYGQGFPKSMDVSKAIDKAAGHWRGRAGAQTSDNGSMSGANYERTDKGDPITAAAAAAGWGTALKPAFEPVVVGRKPFAGTVADNFIKHGTGAINVGANRIGTDVIKTNAKVAGQSFSSVGDGHGFTGVEESEHIGRWPTNVLLEESQAIALDEQSGILTSGLMKARTNRAPRAGGTIYGADKRNIVAGDTYADTGGASRFFPTFRYEAKAATSERPQVDGEQHSTVKPLDLMRWLVRLVTQPGGRVLDPFGGSGTTGEAALLEGMEVVLIEMEAVHLPLILQRIRKPLQQSLFGELA